MRRALRAKRWGLWTGAGLSLAAALAGSCKDPTEIVLHVTSDFPCDASGTAVTSISVAGTFDDITAPSATTATCPAGRPNDLGTMVLVPSGRGDEVVIEVIAGVHGAPCDPHGDVKGCVVAKRRIRYLARARTELPIVLHA